ncbi:TerC family protein [Geomonas oryzisoli]|uniref:TerC family protein n=1 Tax=Geomonas oryzisoli TaxID=2847992 RepID=A0ABX8J7G5_9BACT|nr:TerC family protein [Geomonas oryzisoli]QWV94384.1 TerC family protein [Geomonas oryzisoli]
MTNREMMWIAFAGIITVMFILDLFVFNRKSHEIKFREALAWTVVWVGLAMAFNVGVWYVLGPAKALEFLTGYIIEESLSVDNLFVFIMIFSYFKVARAHQPKILKWGIIGALVMRGIFIVVGIELIERFHWMVYVFGAVLIYTGFKMAFGGDDEVHPEHNPLVRLARRFIPITRRARGDHFFIKRCGIWAATPLFLTLLVVESSDVIFAVDSIPAVLAVTHDPFIVYSSNIFAIMGLRSLYYLLAHVMEMFVHLKLGVSVILAFVGAKMLLADLVEIPLQLSLGVIVGALTISVLSSIFLGGKKGRG